MEKAQNGAGGCKLDSQKQSPHNRVRGESDRLILNEIKEDEGENEMSKLSITVSLN